MWVPLREYLAYASGAALFVGGLGLLARRTADTAALALTIYLCAWVFVLQAPRVAKAPADTGMWLGLCESLLLMSGAWILYALLASPRSDHADNSVLRFLVSDRGVLLARCLMGFACLIFGLSHFVYARFTAEMVPTWLPYHLGFAYLTGAGHLCAGAALLSGVLPRLAATCEAIMICIFVLLIHIPGAISTPGNRLSWTMLFIASALAGAAWNAATSLRNAPWGLREVSAVPLL
jgi:uncharacterized membrane protein